MLTKNDLNQIGKAVKSEITEALGDFFEDNLAPYLEEEFESVKKRLDKVEQRLDKVEQRLDKVEHRLDKVEQRLDKVETELRYVKNDVRDLKADMPTKENFKNLRILEEIHKKEIAAYA